MVGILEDLLPVLCRIMGIQSGGGMDGISLPIQENMQRLAVIGTGIAGMGCAHLLQHKYDLTLYEQNDYIGGHTNTVSVDEDGTPVYFDTGFMVFNYQTYPLLCKLFEELKAPVKKTSMSFSVQHLATGLEYCGSGLNGLFAQRKNLFNPSYIRMLADINRFNKTSIRILDDPAYAHYSLGAFMKAFGFGEDMLWKYLIPMSSAVWSTPMERMLDFPAISLIRFFKNHGFLGLDTQHQWYTLENGSQSYRELLISPFREKIRIGCAARKVSKVEGGVQVMDSDGIETRFDKVIFASHADQALKLLESPTEMEQALLSPFQYQQNTATIHTDEGLMPGKKKAWSSWNYRIEEKEGKRLPSTIYWMNSLQDLKAKKNYFVSISDPGSVDEEKVLRRIVYEHPLFDIPAMKAQAQLHQLNRNGPLYFCGSYFKYGFHEDAYASAVELCLNL
jgi:predicted NAD/FAD-binding protein